MPVLSLRKLYIAHHHHGGSRTVAGLRLGDGQHREPRARTAWLYRQVLAHAAGNGISEAQGQRTGRGAGGKHKRKPERMP